MSSDSGTYGRPEERLLALLPETRDAESVARVLKKVGVAVMICATAEELCAGIERGAGVLLITEERLSPETVQCLVRVLDRQPPWSELPIIVLLRQGSETSTAQVALLLPGDVTLVERPVRVTTLVAVVRSALRSRRRQYLVRAQLQALDESEARYRALFDSLDEGFCVIEVIFDEDGQPVDYRFLQTNPSFARQTGLLDAKGKRMRELAPRHEEHWFEIYGRVALTGEAVRFQNPAEQLGRWYDVYAFRFGLPERRQVAVLFSDITDRRLAEIALRQAKEDLEVRVRERTEDLARALQELKAEAEQRLRAAEEMRRKDQLLMQQGRMAAMGEMIGFIAHQWRQPLNTLGLIIQGLSIQCEMGELDRQSLDVTSAEAMRVIRQMSQTIEDFRNFFKPDREKATFRIKEVLAHTLKLIEANFRESTIAVEVSAADDVVVEGYPNEYSQVLLNILMNARDVLLEREVESRRVEIRIFTENGKAVTTIVDNAGGIPEEAIERIFDAYFTTKAHDKGTGIGLYMAKTIIEGHMEGRLSVRNLEGGAEFRIELPELAH